MFWAGTFIVGLVTALFGIIVAFYWRRYPYLLGANIPAAIIGGILIASGIWNLKENIKRFKEQNQP